MNAMSAHAVLVAGAPYDQVLGAVQTMVTTGFPITHTTIQVEPIGHEEHETHL
jgi:hypothetical protein